MKHNRFGKQYNGEWRARIVDLALFSGCRPDDVTKIEDDWFDASGRLTYTASKNQTLVVLQDETDALSETVLWLRKFKRQERKLSRFLCVYPRYLGLRLYRQERVDALWVSRQWRDNCVATGYFTLNSSGNKVAQYQYRDIRKKSLADDPGNNKGGHKTQAMQDYYESVKKRPVFTSNTLTNPRNKITV